MIEEILQYIVEAKEGKYSPYFKPIALSIAKAFDLVLSDEYPAELLDIVRPNEPDKVKEYRRSVYENIIIGDFSKIVTTLQKIRISDGFRISFVDSDRQDYNDFKQYVTAKFPHSYSLENWVFSFMLPQKLKDPNAICIVYPKNFDKPEEEPEPVPYIFGYERVVIDEPELIVVQQKESAEKTCYIAVDLQKFYYIEVVGKNSSYTEVEHGFGELPAFKLGGPMFKMKDEKVLYTSYIYPCLSYWRPAIRRKNDEEASMILHINPEKWQYTNRQCKACRGKKSVGGESCQDCNGSGYELVSSPFGVHTIHPEKVGLGEGAPVVTPPAGYITKPTDDVKFLGESIERNLYSALRAINLEFLGQEYLNQSGTAKEMDRKEVQSFLYQVAQSLVEANIKPLIRYITGWKYKFLPNWRELVPVVTLPKDFDVLSTAMLRERVEQLKSGNFNASIVAKSEIEYFAREYGKDSLEYIVLVESSNLDPLQGKTEDQKQNMLLARVIDKQTYLASSRIRDFIKKAIEQNAEFPTLQRSQKQEIIKQFAQDEVSALNNSEIQIFD